MKGMRDSTALLFGLVAGGAIMAITYRSFPESRPSGTRCGSGSRSRSMSRPVASARPAPSMYRSWRVLRAMATWSLSVSRTCRPSHRSRRGGRWSGNPSLIRARLSDCPCCTLHEAIVNGDASSRTKFARVGVVRSSAGPQDHRRGDLGIDVSRTDS